MRRVKLLYSDYSLISKVSFVSKRTIAHSPLVVNQPFCYIGNEHTFFFFLTTIAIILAEST